MIPNGMEKSHSAANLAIKLLNGLFRVEDGVAFPLQQPFLISLTHSLSPEEADYFIDRLEINGWSAQYNPKLNEAIVYNYDPARIQMTIQAF